MAVIHPQPRAPFLPFRYVKSLPDFHLQCRQFLIEVLGAGGFNGRMSDLMKGGISGLIFGAISVGMMLPMSFPDKRAALLGAFTNRFAIGFVIGCVTLPAWPGWALGVLFALLLSLPAAIISKAYAPILILGALGGAIIGGIIHGWR
jgi:hypothetical protein